jgi:hypothetical protein
MIQLAQHVENVRLKGELRDWAGLGQARPESKEQEVSCLLRVGL